MKPLNYFLYRTPKNVRSRDRPVRIGPRFSKFCWSWSGSVRDFKNFFGSGPVRSEIFQNVLVLVRLGPRFSKFYWSWSLPVAIFKIFLVLVLVGPRFLKFFWSWSGSVRDFRIFFPRRGFIFTETASVLDPESGQNQAIY